jgi:hypothetical protein
MLALPDLLVSATLVAVSVTVWLNAIVPGAVYSSFNEEPFGEMLPTPGGLIDQVTAVLFVPVTLAMNIDEFPGESRPLGGLTVTVTCAMARSVRAPQRAKETNKLGGNPRHVALFIAYSHDPERVSWRSRSLWGLGRLPSGTRAVHRTAPSNGTGYCCQRDALR